MFSSAHLALIVPTKNRPEYVSTLLDSLEKQIEKPGLLVIVDSGGSSKNVVEKYLDNLDIDYVNTEVTGQLPQRKLGLGRLESHYNLVGFLDDDIVLEEDALSEMLKMWNSRDEKTAAISFNIVNSPAPRKSIIERLMLSGGSKEGAVLSSGYNVGYFPARENMEIQWTCGGATIWRKAILDKNPQEVIRSKWAISEDVIYSYPISKKNKLYVCANARAKDTGKQSKLSNRRSFYQGQNATMWKYYFVKNNSDLKLVSFSWMTIAQILVRIVSGIGTFRSGIVSYALGQVSGLGWVLLDITYVRDIRKRIDEIN